MAIGCAVACFRSSCPSLAVQSSNGTLSRGRSLEHAPFARQHRRGAFLLTPDFRTARNITGLLSSCSQRSTVARCMQQPSPPQQQELQRLQRRLCNLAPPNGLPELSVLTFNVLADGLSQHGDFIRVRTAVPVA